MTSSSFWFGVTGRVLAGAATEGAATGGAVTGGDRTGAGAGVGAAEAMRCGCGGGSAGVGAGVLGAEATRCGGGRVGAGLAAGAGVVRATGEGAEATDVAPSERAFRPAYSTFAQALIANKAAAETARRPNIASLPKVSA